ncbi:MAG TPA: hypothetical protein VET30_09335 [Pseudoxanthomonas sp.]|nr:hypothetical protein [Pseudoxanthomonas sp.]
MPANPRQAAAPPPALSAFLRGVERRGALFAELQCGDSEAGDTALAAAMRAFRNHAGTLPMADWPRRFWTLLVAAPPLRQASPLAQWPRGLHTLAPLQPVSRQALLLRLAASLSTEDAAAVLGVATTAYEQTLATACPRDAEGQPDALAWRMLAETVQQQLRDLAPERLARLAALREAAITGTGLAGDRAARVGKPAVGPSRPRHAAQTTTRRRWPWVALVVVVCAAALAATWWWPQWQRSHEVAGNPDQSIQRLQDEVEIIREELPAQQPAARYDVVTGLLLHPDFDLVMDIQDEAVARDADFLAWYASGANALPVAVAEEVNPAIEAITTEKETSDAQL